MDSSTVVERVQELTDLELAILLCLVADQSCIIQTEKMDMQSLEQELQLIVSDVFGLSYAVAHCDGSTRLEDFSNGILVDAGPRGDFETAEVSGGLQLNETFDSESGPSQTRLPKMEKTGSGPREQKIANVVLVRGLPEADEQIQIQALELLRTRRIYTHTAVYAAPKHFLLILLGSLTDPALVGHLNDHIYLSHYHDPEEGYPNLEQSSDWLQDDHASNSSVILRSARSIQSSTRSSHRFPIEDIQAIARLAQDVVITAESQAYLHNLIVFLRLNRAVRTGASPTATIHFKLLSRILGSLHGYSFATPAVIRLAFRKIYRHRIKITAADFERSMQYGSDLHAISAMLKGITADEVLENVLTAVEVPV